ncbi:hypothetical protein GCM10011495_23170 [Hymenobacter frigidus]|uniref:Response regulatory domain-containing protein n=1 Tax=Hymenobacter frigidus TaxID=1524095 RepID=A0ABQ2A5J3_9BACT|nr:response regulator [Hymenobacter frigidus]GGH86486.1 hypothetical protein GCM10011495_23170 [Hymenobacter frigidus]
MLTYLIDDDPVSLFLTEHMLRLEGFMAPILAFAGAEEALAHLLPRLATNPPGLIFLDLNMPVMDGWGFLDALAPHASALQDGCRIYLLTSSLALVDTEKARDHALVHGIIHKPLDEETIRAVVLKKTRTQLAAAPAVGARSSRGEA